MKVSLEKSSDEIALNGPKLKREQCLFCDRTLPFTRLENHCERKHSELLFSCDNFCPQQYKSPWVSEVITHLKVDHDRREGDEVLSRHYIRMPSNLKMIVCRVKDCDEAVYLGRTCKELLLDLETHLATAHPGMALTACFSLACRGCGYTLSLEQEEEWTQHIALDHRKPGVHRRIRCVSSSSFEHIVESNRCELGNASSCMEENSNTDKTLKELEHLQKKFISCESNQDDRSGMQGTAQEAGTENCPPKGEPEKIVCKFCLDSILPIHRMEHLAQDHGIQMLKCYKCLGDEKFLCAEVQELQEHFNQSHDGTFEMKSLDIQEIDLNMSICKICDQQIYTGDPVVLATHLIDHDLGPDLTKFKKHCRVCYWLGEKTEMKNLKDHQLIYHIDQSGASSQYNITRSKGIRQADRSSTLENYAESDANTNQELQEKLVDSCIKPPTQEMYEHLKLDKDNSKKNKAQFTQVGNECNYCGETVEHTSEEFHILTQHKKNSFRCSLCSRSKIEKTETGSCFQTIQDAGLHLKSIHGMDIDTKLKNLTLGEDGCSAYPVLKSVYSLCLPIDYRMFYCSACSRSLLSQKMAQLHVCAEGLEVLVKCRLCIKEINEKRDGAHIVNYGK